MATLRELIIKISANSSSFQSEISRASRMGADYYRTMENGGKQAAAASRQSQRALAELNNQFVSIKSVAAGFAGALSVTSLITMADSWGQVTSRMKAATTSSDELAVVQNRLMEISDRTYKPIEEQSELFIRSSNAMKELGYSTSTTIDFIDSISSALTINAASADKGASTIDALSKSMVLGKVAGDEWNTIMNVTPTIVGDIARSMGTTETEVKKFASEGKLSMTQFVNSVIEARQRNAELAEDMPTTVGDAITKVSNHLKAYIGNANSASGATQSISGVISDLADNIEAVVTATGGLIALGFARYFGGVVSGAANATTGLITAARAEVALAEAQVRGTQISTARARAAVYRAQQALIAARNTDGQALAERRLGAAQALLTRNIAARTAAQASLNSVTAVGSRLLSGMMGIVGGIPGLVLLGAGAWYYTYQQQEQARASAEAYAKTLDEVRAKIPTMTLPTVSENQDSAKRSLAEQNTKISEQLVLVNDLERRIISLNKAREQPDWKKGSSMYSVGDAENIKAIEEATANLATEQARLGQMQEEAKNIGLTLEEIMRRRVDLLREQTWKENASYQSLLMMNGQHSELNRLLSLGNNLLSARQGLANIPIRIPDAQLNTNQQNLLDKSRQAVELSKLKGEAAARKQAEFAADAAGLASTPEFATARSEYISNELTRFRNDQSNKPAKKGPKTDEDKAADAYKRLVENQKEEIALAGQSTELAKTKYKIAEGEFSILSDVQKTELLRNAAALDHLKTQEKFKALQQDLLTPEEELLQKTRERIKLLKEAAPATEDYRKTMERISKESVQEAPKFSGIDASVGGASGELGKVADAEKELKKWHKTQLELQKELLDEKTINEETYANRVAEINKTNATQLTDIQAGYTSASLGMFADLAGQSASLLQGIGQEGSAAYKALFIASKAAAIAQAIVNTEVAATKAMAEGGLILGMPAATAIRAVGYASVALIAGQTIAGMAHDGIDRVPETGTWLLQRGERVVTAQTSAKLDSTLERVQQQKQEDRGLAAGGFNYSPTIQVNGDPDDRTMLMLESAVKKGAQQGYQMVTNHLATGRGDVSKAFQAGWMTKRRAG